MTATRDERGNIIIDPLPGEPVDPYLERLMAVAPTYGGIVWGRIDGCCFEVEHGRSPGEVRRNYEGSRPKKAQQLTNSITVTLGEKLFEFSSQQDWVNHGPRIWRVHRATNGRAMAIDAKGRVCQMGGHFMRATKDDAYPVSVYRVDPDAREHGMEADLSHAALFGEPAGEEEE